MKRRFCQSYVITHILPIFVWMGNYKQARRRICYEA